MIGTSDSCIVTGPEGDQFTTQANKGWMDTGQWSLPPLHSRRGGTEGPASASCSFVFTVDIVVVVVVD